MFARLRSWFLAGLLVLVPTGLTVWFFHWSWRQVDSLALILLPGRFWLSIPGAGAVMVVLAILSVGAMASSWLGGRVVGMYEWMALQLPVLGTFFKTVKDVSGMIFDDTSTSFSEVVLIEYPRLGSWTLGFVAAPAADELSAVMGVDDGVSVFVATSPNPTSGVLVFLPRRECKILKMKPEEAFKLVMSAGLITPAFLAATQSTAPTDAVNP